MGNSAYLLKEENEIVWTTIEGWLLRFKCTRMVYGMGLLLEINWAVTPGTSPCWLGNHKKANRVQIGQEN